MNVYSKSTHTHTHTHTHRVKLEKLILYNIAYMWNTEKKIVQMKLFAKHRDTQI